MRPPLAGIHHLTAIVDDPQENIDFYTNVLGLRLVKQTVNFDDPNTYHFYYGDETGRPGTLVTFFPWPDGRRGSRGTGQISALAFAVPPGALAFWQQQLSGIGWHFSDPEQRAGGAVLAFYDPAGLLVELVETPDVGRGTPFAASDVPPSAAIRGLYGVTLTVAAVEPTAAYLVEQLGFRSLTGEPGQQRYAIGVGQDTAVITLVARPDVPRGSLAAGAIHHVAWRVPDEAALLNWRTALEGQNASVTPIRERQYFRSVYFREPGGVLFELATDGPGFTIDEPPTSLGAHLMLPPWLEPQREVITQRLPPVTLEAQTAHTTTTAFEVGGRVVEQTEHSMSPLLGFHHVFVPAQTPDAPTLLLLHGTGGNQHDLLDLGRALLPEAALLSPRGQVLEHGMPRFFRRLAEGVFDLDDLRRRTHELADFVAMAATHYGFTTQRVIAVGYSNGANIAASTLLLRPAQLAGAVLLHAMVPLVPEQLPTLTGVPVFLSAGRADRMVPARQAEQLAALLQQAGASLTLHWTPGGHALSQGEIQAAKSWLHANATAMQPGVAGAERSER